MIANFRRMHGQVVLLVAAQALFQTASTLVMTIGALAGAPVAPNPQLATAPIAAMFLGTVLTTMRQAAGWSLDRHMRPARSFEVLADQGAGRASQSGRPCSPRPSATRRC